MTFARTACWVCVAALALLAGGSAVAQAGTRNDDILVLSSDGKARAHTATGATAAEARPPRRAARTTATAKKKPKRTVLRELARLRDRAAITPEDYTARRASYTRAKQTARKLTGTRKRELTAVIATLDGIAQRGKLTATRVAPLFLTLDRNVEWWTTGPIPASGQRVGFAGSELVWQYYAGQGMQIQWLGTFGKLNALAKGSKRNNARTSLLVDEALSLAAQRAGGIAWEYEFPFGGGAAPWVSSLSQGTGLQALARAAQKLGREEEVLPVAERGLGVFATRTPEGVRVGPRSGWAGPHYAQYSFAPSLYILNGFVQSLVGLHDFAAISGSTDAMALYLEGEREAAREVPKYDTGAWSLYSTGTSEHESSLSYHQLLVDFLESLCDRTQSPVYCGTAARFTAYESEPPVVRVAAQRVRGGKPARLRVRVNKMSALSVRVVRDGKVTLSRYLGTVPYGLTRVSWSAPRRAGTYEVQVTARDLSGNPGGAGGTVEVLKPVKRKPKRG